MTVESVCQSLWLIQIPKYCKAELIHHPKRTRENQAAIKDRIEIEMLITKLTETLEAQSTGVILR